MKASLLLVSLLILTACNDNHSQAPVPSVPVVTPPTEPPIEPVPTHTRSELSVRLDVTTRLGQGATLLLRQAATGIAVSGEVGEERPLVMTLPAGLLLDQPLELVGSDG
ncbi:cytochrome-c peroxidase, partial [Aeromonas hydrophila]